MRHKLILLMLAAAGLTLAVADEGRAQLPGQENSFKRSERFWKMRDLCQRNAQKAFPDYTAEGNAKRERSYRQCLEANNLPYEPNPSTGPSRR